MTDEREITLFLLAEAKAIDYFGGIENCTEEMLKPYIEGYMAGHRRAAAAGYNYLECSRDWIHHPTAMLIAAKKDLEYEIKLDGIN